MGTRKTDDNPANRDPITGAPGSHPVGTAAGATSGGVAGAVVGTAVGGPVVGLWVQRWAPSQVGSPGTPAKVNVPSRTMWNGAIRTKSSAFISSP